MKVTHDPSDPGTPEARRAWLDSLPVGSVVVDACGDAFQRLAYGWAELGSPDIDADVDWWCDFGRPWPARSVSIPRPTLGTVAHEIEQWQTAQFGPPGDPLVSLAKMLDEVAELRDELRQVPIPGTEREHTARIREELADVLFLVVDLARGFGGVDALTEAADAKLARNRARVWTQGPDGKWSGSKAVERD